VELVEDAKRADLHDAGAAVLVIGEDAALRAGQADRAAAERVDRDREQGHRLALAGAEQHVELA
jgi:hypothetical protein